MLYSLLLRFILLFFLGMSSTIYADRIRDLTSIQGTHENQLIGYGLVVGLDGTGDQIIHVPLTLQTLNNMLSQFGIDIQSNKRVQIKNIAAVVVTAELPNFSHQGQKIDVVVSSIGDAKSLKGGTLLMTPLKGIDNKIYAIAQGNVLIGSHTNQSFTYHRQNYINQLNGGRISNGAIIEKEIKTQFGQNKTFNLQLNQEDFTIAQYISDAINRHYPNSSIVLDARTIQLNTPDNNSTKIRMISNIQNINIDLPEKDAKVIFNARTGSIVINKEVRLDICAITNENISVIINKKNKTNKSHVFVINTQIRSTSKKNNKIKSVTTNIQSDINSVNLHNIVHALNLLGTTPVELMSILQAMKNAGCLHAQLEII
ncbi:flagellar basal body P-ring protein FlgI [Buchnera aphidicola (Pemphigus obesinymphae)]|nr:flagellar basal body P-ring protein FlgI [Buchnera aphidicola (Pemphigus obesinymphae)]